MPAWLVASMMVLPSATSSFLPSISISSINSDVVRNHALLVIDVMPELVAKMLDKALHWQRRGIPQRADGAALDVVGDMVQQVEVFGAAFAVLDAVDHAIHPAGTFAARRALAT